MLPRKETIRLTSLDSFINDLICPESTKDTNIFSQREFFKIFSSKFSPVSEFSFKILKNTGTESKVEQKLIKTFESKFESSKILEKFYNN